MRGLRIPGFLLLAALFVAGCHNDDDSDGRPGPGPGPSGSNIFMTILPAGSNGNSAGGIGAPVPGAPVLQYPANYRDQLDLYGNLAYAQQGLKADSCTPPASIAEHQPSSDQACNYFKDGGFTPVTVVSSRELAAPNGRTVKIERDGWGVPFVTGADRASALYGMGFAAAQDRLWLFDVLRYAGRGRASEALGPSATTYDLDLEFGVPGGYSEDELTDIVNAAVAKIGAPLGPMFLNDVEMFVAGMNAFIAYLQTPAGASELPPEYLTLGLKVPPLFPPRPFTVNDIVANAVLIQSALGLGGGGEATNLELLQKLDAGFTAGSTSIPAAACRLWRDLRHANAPETAHSTDRVYATQSPASVNESCPQSLPAGVAIWDPGSLQGRQILSHGAGILPVPLLDLEDLPGIGPVLRGLGSLLPLPNLGPLPIPGLSQVDDALQPPLRSATNTLLAAIDPLSLRRTLTKHGLPATTSNWIGVNASQTKTGHPLIVAGPQTGYFQPQLLWEVSVVSTGGTEFDLTARGISTVNLPYVVIGHGRDFGWSPTSAGSDFTDIRVSLLCNTDGSPASRDDADGDGFPDADGYRYDVNRDGQVAANECVRFYRRLDEWDAIPTPASIALGGPVGAELVRRYILRTHYGPVIATATVGGAPVAISTQRSTFMADVDTAAPFALLTTNGEKMTHSRFKQLFNSMTSTFNWIYADGRDLAYIQSGLYPRRHPAHHPELPVWGDGRFEWIADQGLNAAFFSSYGGDDSSDGDDDDDGVVSGTVRAFPSRTVPVAQAGRAGYYEWPGFLSLAEHIQDVNPAKGYLANWNNSGAPGWWAADANGSYGPTHRMELLQQRLKSFRATGRKHDVASMIEIMGDAAYGDLRGMAVLPLILQLMRSDTLTADQQAVVDLMQAWIDEGSNRWIANGPGLGALRRDRDADGAYDMRAAVVLMDAWYPRLIDGLLPQLVAVEAQGGSLLQGRYDSPGPVGSAYQSGWFQHMKRVLQMAMNVPGHVNYQALSCADGSQAGCRAAVLAALDQALADLGGLANQAAWDGSQIYGGTTVEEHDAVVATSFALLPVPPIHWINRPTFQQVTQINE